MKTLTAIDDPVFQPVNSLNFLERFFLQFIKDERDLPFIWLSIVMTFTIIPSAILLFTSLYEGWYWWIAAVIHGGLLIYFLGPFTLMLHNTSHRMFFKRAYKVGNLYIPWVLSPFSGQSPETYFSHHIGMHHAENNLYPDKSSTMPYQRDSFVDFLKYFGNFLFIGVIELVNYFRKKQIMRFVKKVLRGEFSYLIMCIVLSFVNWQATLIVFILPIIIVRFAMMSGNWAQHAFIDAQSPENSYRNSITCINSVYNKRCFNDGYHIGHHLRPHMHWTDMPTDFLKNQENYAKENAIVFDGLDYHQVWFWLMLKRYDVLAKHFVNLGNRFQTQEEVIELLQERTQKL